MKSYLFISGSLFALFGLVHILRLWEHWSVQISDWNIPLAASWVVVALSGALSIWAFQLAGCCSKRLPK